MLPLVRRPLCLSLVFVLLACGSDDGPPVDDTTTGEPPASTGAPMTTASAETTEGSTGPSADGTTESGGDEESSGSTGAGSGLKDVYDLDGAGLFPEGVTWDPVARAFYVGSLGDGSVHRVDAETGEQKTFSSPIALAWSTSGIKVDADNRRLWACASERGGGKAQVVWVFDLESTELLESFDLGDIADGADCNDVALGPDGRAYASDPPLGVVHRLELGGTAEIWATSPSFTPDVPGLGLNGLAVTPDESALIVAKFLPPTLFRISLEDPTAITKITLTGDLFEGGTAISGADGIVFVDDALFVVFDDVVKRVDLDAGATMGVVSTIDPPSDGLSTATVAEGELYVVKSEVTAFVLGQRPELPFQILRVPVP
jgi:sugar lactone lactonase YvrE